MTIRLPTIALTIVIALSGICVTQTVAQDVITSPSGDQREPIVSATYFQRMKLLTLAEGDPNCIIFTVRGKVVAPDGEPVKDAMVVLRESSTFRYGSSNKMFPVTSTGPYMVNDVFARTTTDKYGNYEFVKVAAPMVTERYQKRWDWHVVAAVPNGQVGWSQLKRGYTVPDTIELVRDIRLRATNPLTGKLLSAQGQPVAHAYVRSTSLRQADSEAGGYQSVDELDLNASSLQLSVQSDQNGQFTFPAIPIGLAASVYIQSAEHAFPPVRIASPEVVSKLRNEVRNHLEPVSVYGETVSSPATIQAAPQLTIRGVLRDESGSPLSERKITLGSFVKYAVTDGQGRFEWPITHKSLNRQGFAPGDLPQVVRFYARDLGDNYVSLVHEEPLENLLASREVRLIATKGVEVSGKVITKGDKQPIPDIRVYVTPANDSNPLKALSALTDANGAYQIVAPKVPVIVSIGGTVPGLVLPSYRSSLDKSIADEFSRVIDLTPGDAVTLRPFEVERAAGIQIHVVDDADNPISAAHVTASYLTSIAPQSSHRSPRDLSPDAVTDERGRCRIYPKVQDWEDGLVRAEGNVNGERWFGSELLTTGSNQLVKIRLKKPWRVVGRVLLDGAPAMDVQVFLTRRVDDRSRPTSKTMQYIDSTSTDKDGAFAFITAANEEYGVSVKQPPGGAARSRRAYYPKVVGDGLLRFPDIQYQSPSGTNDQPKIQLGTIRGIIKDVDGRPISGAQVRLQQYSDGAYYRAIRDQFPITPATTDDKGKFQLIGMPPGEVYLSIYPSRNENETKFIATIIRSTVGNESVSVVVDPGLVRELPRIEPVRVLPISDRR
ncbi:MAG: carboxypeptidase regulatory-like domain-containing protein [Planctomycetales bacterium]|nr:carboxypeptidase regulatory-like domain-containing protein [Planctomycetales bacterium]